MTRFTYIPNRVIDTDGIASGASIYVYRSGGTTPVNLFTDSSYTTPVSNPYVVSAGATVPTLYTDYIGTIRVRVVTLDGEVPLDEDPYSGPLSSADIGVDTGAGLVGTELGDSLQVFMNGYATRSGIKALTPSDGARAFLREGPRAGWFVFDTSDLSTEVTGDTLEAVYIPPNSDATGASGAWVRRFEGLPFIGWFGIEADSGVDETANFDDAVASGSPGANGFQLGVGEYILGDWTPPVGSKIVGWGDSFNDFSGSSKANTVIKREPTATFAIDLSGTSHVLLQYLDVIGNGGLAAGNASPIGNRQANGSFPFQVTIVKCRMSDGYAGIDGDPADPPGGLRVYDCHLTDNTWGARNCKDTAYGFNTFTRNKEGHFFSNGGQIRFFSNFLEFAHDSGSAADAILLGPNSSEVLITGCQFDRISRNSIRVQGTSGGNVARHIHISNNFFKGCGWSTDALSNNERVSIKFVGDATYVTIVGNTFERRPSFPSLVEGYLSPLAAIDLGDAKYVTLMGNNTVQVESFIEITQGNAMFYNSVDRTQYFEWVSSAANPGEYYLYNPDSADGNPWVVEPAHVWKDGTALTKNPGANPLLANEWDYTDKDSLGFNTIYVNTGGNPATVPDRMVATYNLPTIDTTGAQHVKTEYELDSNKSTIATTVTDTFELVTSDPIGTNPDRKSYVLEISGDESSTGNDFFYKFPFIITGTNYNAKPAVVEGTKQSFISAVTAQWATTAAGETLEVSIASDERGGVFTVSIENTGANTIRYTARLLKG